MMPMMVMMVGVIVIGRVDMASSALMIIKPSVWTVDCSEVRSVEDSGGWPRAFQFAIKADHMLGVSGDDGEIVTDHHHGEF